MNYGYQILTYFKYEHLPPHLQEISKPFCELAESFVGKLSGPETSAGLRKLLEAKDCFVRAALNEKMKVGSLPISATEKEILGKYLEG